MIERNPFASEMDNEVNDYDVDWNVSSFSMDSLNMEGFELTRNNVGTLEHLIFASPELMQASLYQSVCAYLMTFFFELREQKWAAIALVLDNERAQYLQGNTHQLLCWAVATPTKGFYLCGRAVNT